MAAPARPQPAGAGGPENVYKDAVTELRSSLTCRVCLKLLYEPFTVSCGHTFCYECLNHWFKSSQAARSCPECRAKIKQMPAQAFVIRDMVLALCKDDRLLPPGEGKEEHQSLREEMTALLEQHKRSDAGLFEGSFNKEARANAIYDDSVWRCPECLFELEDQYCRNCDEWFDDDGNPIDVRDGEGSSLSSDGTYSPSRYFDVEASGEEHMEAERLHASLLGFGDPAHTTFMDGPQFRTFQRHHRPFRAPRAFTFGNRNPIIPPTRLEPSSQPPEDDSNYSGESDEDRSESDVSNLINDDEEEEDDDEGPYGFDSDDEPESDIYGNQPDGHGAFRTPHPDFGPMSPSDDEDDDDDDPPDHDDSFDIDNFSDRELGDDDGGLSSALHTTGYDSGGSTPPPETADEDSEEDELMRTHLTSRKRSRAVVSSDSEDDSDEFESARPSQRVKLESSPGTPDSDETEREVKEGDSDSDSDATEREAKREDEDDDDGDDDDDEPVRPMSRVRRTLQEPMRKPAASSASMRAIVISSEADGDDDDDDSPIPATRPRQRQVNMVVHDSRPSSGSRDEVNSCSSKSMTEGIVT